MWEDLDEVKKYVEEDKVDINEKFPPLIETALHLAISSGYIEIIEYLIDNDADSVIIKECDCLSSNKLI